jgi:hypothetical protein
MITHDEIVKKLADKLRKEVSGLGRLTETPEEIAESLLPTIRHLVSVAQGDTAQSAVDYAYRRGYDAPHTALLKANLLTLREYGPLTPD